MTTKRRELVEQLHARQPWSAVAKEAVDIGFHIRDMLDLGGVPNMTEVGRLSDLLCRLEEPQPTSAVRLVPPEGPVADVEIDFQGEFVEFVVGKGAVAGKWQKNIDGDWVLRLKVVSNG